MDFRRRPLRTSLNSLDEPANPDTTAADQLQPDGQPLTSHLALDVFDRQLAVVEDACGQDRVCSGPDGFGEVLR